MGFSLPEMDFLPPEWSGLACRRLPRSAQLLHTLFCLRLGPKYFSTAVACPAGRDPGSALPRRGLPPGCAPRAAPDPASCPFAFIFTGAGLSLTFVCGENGGALGIWKDERQMGIALFPCVRT